MDFTFVSAVFHLIPCYTKFTNVCRTGFATFLKSRLQYALTDRYMYYLSSCNSNILSSFSFKIYVLILNEFMLSFCTFYNTVGKKIIILKMYFMFSQDMYPVTLAYFSFIWFSSRER